MDELEMRIVRLERSVVAARRALGLVVVAAGAACSALDLVGPLVLALLAGAILLFTKSPHGTLPPTGQRPAGAYARRGSAAP